MSKRKTILVAVPVSKAERDTLEPGMVVQELGPDGYLIEWKVIRARPWQEKAK